VKPSKTGTMSGQSTEIISSNLPNFYREGIADKVQFQQAERISPETNMKKAAMPTMIPATGTHLFTPPSSDRVFRMSPDGCNVFILMTVLVSIIFCL